MISWLYSAFFWLIILAWPTFLKAPFGEFYFWLALVINSATALFVIYRCSSTELNFVYGIDVIAGSSMSGCANITIIYLPPLLVFVYLIALFYSVVSLFQGRAYSQGRWLALVEGFRKRSLNAPLNPLTHIKPPDASNFKINPDDSQNLLEAASLWEMEGEWEKAIGLYEQAAEKLKGQQDGEYAANCILRIKEKIARTEGG
jgi:hypothetical protein